MATTFYSNKPVNAKPMHNGAVIYADDTCIRTITSELLGGVGGGGVEIAGAFLFSMGFFSWIFLSNHDLNFFSIGMMVGVFLIFLPMLLFRYKPNYLVFSRKSQEIYYVKSPKNIIKFNWSEVKAEYRRGAVFSGSAVSQMSTLTLIGTNLYGNKPPESAVIAFVVLDETDAKEFWSYLQTYMKKGAKGLEKPYYEWVKEGFIPEASRLTKQTFYSEPKGLLQSVFSPKSKLPIWFRIIALPASILFIPIILTFIYPAQIATALVGSTRKRTPIPDDLLPYITDNPESWGENNPK